MADKNNILKPKDKKIIALIGMMGVGKSTIGFKLAQKLGINFIDSDREIENKEQKSISEIFSENGEDYFRQLEYKTIKEIINKDKASVLSLGGGAFINAEIRKLVKENCLSIWLDCDIDVILSRVSGKKSRPLLEKGDKKEILTDLIAKRQEFYEQADIKIDTAKHSSKEVINDIIEQMINFMAIIP